MPLVVNRSHVVAETIDDETILIHLGSGIYYSLQGVGSVVWRLGDLGWPASDIVSGLVAAHPGDATVAPAVAALLDQFALEDLLVEGPGEQPQAAEGQALLGALTGPFAAPALQKYTDMQEFMLVDPLHDVDEEAGWPHAKAG